MNDGDARSLAEKLLSQTQLGECVALERLQGGRNNRIYRINTEDRPLILKSYFEDPDDSRDRCGTETAFLKFTMNQHINTTPQLVAVDPEAKAALHSFVPGRRLSENDINDERVTAALDFVIALNEHRSKEIASELPLASEAYFSISDHRESIDERLRKLIAIERAGALDREVVSFVSRTLIPALDKIRIETDRVKDSIDRSYACISPSDFGFHNALLLYADDGSVVFHDFEYAGWDDPAKLISDFFCQPQIPVPIHYLPKFCQKISDLLSYSELDARVRTLLPLLEIKWCAIVLNDFVAEGARRREFAGDREDSSERRRRQFTKAKQLFNSYQQREVEWPT